MTTTEQTVNETMHARLAEGLDPLTGRPLVTVGKITSTAGRCHDETGRTVTLDDAGRWVYAEHHSDADCAGCVDPETDTCSVCGVDHGGQCDLCGGRGYHADDCEIMARTDA